MILAISRRASSSSAGSAAESGCAISVARASLTSIRRRQDSWMTSGSDSPCAGAASSPGKCRKRRVVSRASQCGVLARSIRRTTPSCRHDSVGATLMRRCCQGQRASWFPWDVGMLVKRLSEAHALPPSSETEQAPSSASSSI